MSNEVPERIPEDRYVQMVMKKCEDNHIWLNKLTYLHPTDEQKVALANMILEKLNQRSTQMPSHGITSDIDVIRELSVMTPMLYIQVNWS